MITATKVIKNLIQYGKIALILLTLVSAVSCCPKDGVDRSVHNDSFNITLEIYNQNNQHVIDYLDEESKLTLILNNGVRTDSQNFSQDFTNRNRFTFYFDSSIQDDDVANVEVKLIDFQNQNLNYKTVLKAPYQRDAKPIAKSSWDGIFCKLNPIDWILPQAHALSCKPKEGSQLTWRSGYLIKLILLPEI